MTSLIFWDFFAPFCTHFTKKVYGVTSPFGRSPPPKWVMSFMDGPLRRRCRPGKKVIRKDVTRPFSVWTSSAADVVSRGRRPKRFKKAGSVFSSPYFFFFSKCWYHPTFFQQVITVCWLRYKKCNFNGKLRTKKNNQSIFSEGIKLWPKRAC